MAKSNGLGDNAYVSGYDLSGSITAASKIGGGPALLEATPINKSAHARLGGLLTGEISFQTLFDPAVLEEHVALSGLPTTDVIVSYLKGTTLGNPVANLVAKQINYDWNRGADGSVMGAVQAQNNAVPLEWGIQLTTGKRTDTAATSGTGVADANPYALATAITAISVASPTHVTSTAHGLVTGDSVVIAGTDSTPVLDGEYTITRLDANTFTVPVNVTVLGTTGTVTKTSTSFGLSAYLHVFSFTGTSITVKIQDSMDGITYADLTGGGFTTATGLTKERIQTATGATVRKYLRATSVGTFNPCTFAVAAHRPLTSEW